MIVPVRGIAENGVISDVDAYDLSLNAITTGINIRCQDSHVERGPIARSAGPLPKPPRHMLSYEDLSGATRVVVMTDDGSIVEWTTGTTINRTRPAMAAVDGIAHSAEA